MTRRLTGVSGGEVVTAKQMAETMAKAAPELDRLFDKLNARFFDGAIRKVPVRLGDLEDFGHSEASGFYGLDRDGWTIVLDERLVRALRREGRKPSPWGKEFDREARREAREHIRQLLLHEMCHGDGDVPGDDQGRFWGGDPHELAPWRPRMRRLARMGERWAAVELYNVRRTGSPIGDGFGDEDEQYDSYIERRRERAANTRKHATGRAATRSRAP
jgi:hypothetical protein